jgi:glycosyltransferase involved in cell wall biosynthesis
MTLNKPIVFLAPYYDPTLATGANRRIDEICRKAWNDFGDHFSLIVAKDKRPPWMTSGNVFEVDYKRTVVGRFLATRRISRLLDRLAPSIVVSDWIPVPFRSFRRHVQIQAAWDFRYFRSESRSTLYRLAFHRFLVRQWRRSQYMMTCSEFSIGELERFISYPRDRVITSFFGINEQIFDVPHLPADRKEYDLIYVATFDTHKNHAPLIEALALLPKELKVLLVGHDAGTQRQLMERAKQCGLINVTFTAVREERQVWELYTKSRLFISPSLYEGFGMPTIEALALGLPIALSDIPIFHEVAGDLATYFDPKDPHDIARTIDSLLGNGQPPDPEVVRGRLHPFLWDTIYSKFIQDLSRIP